MKLGVLQSIAHSAADSLVSGIGLLIGVYEIDIFGEAGRSDTSAISVDFLTGKVVEGHPSRSLAKAVSLYRTAFDELCLKQGVEPCTFKVATARFGTDPIYGPHFTVTVVDREGRSATDRYVGSPGKRFA
ncbi:hypothetical protein [Brevundimonas sp. Leaf363]|uniref:hypothetical protein n=1 Tax=Brevundimonas sp. Leaf363 TaxID=1736353 RepID=UPI0006FF6D76|nr:hypothetical protein [Brevundimonas sp. Leaf363]